MGSWNDESGDWQGLASVAQVPRYQQIANLIERYCPNGSVLDIGCGGAVLRDYLSAGVKYLGIEPSARAAESARALNGGDSVVHSTGEDFDPGKDRWDAIVFNEVLYYSPDPIALLEKYAKLLRPYGVIIVSIYQKPESFSLKGRLKGLVRRHLSNVGCTKMVYQYMVREGWLIEYDELVVIPGTSDRQHWRIWQARPAAFLSANT